MGQAVGSPGGADRPSWYTFALLAAHPPNTLLRLSGHHRNRQPTNLPGRRMACDAKGGERPGSVPVQDAELGVGSVGAAAASGNHRNSVTSGTSAPLHAGRGASALPPYLAWCTLVYFGGPKSGHRGATRQRLPPPVRVRSGTPLVRHQRAPKPMYPGARRRGRTHSLPTPGGKGRPDSPNSVSITSLSHSFQNDIRFPNQFGARKRRCLGSPGASTMRQNQS